MITHIQDTSRKFKDKSLFWAIESVIHNLKKSRIKAGEIRNLNLMFNNEVPVNKNDITIEKRDFELGFYEGIEFYYKEISRKIISLKYIEDAEAARSLLALPSNPDEIFGKKIFKSNEWSVIYTFNSSFECVYTEITIRHAKIIKEKKMGYLSFSADMQVKPIQIDRSLKIYFSRNDDFYWLLNLDNYSCTIGNDRAETGNSHMMHRLAETLLENHSYIEALKWAKKSLNEGFLKAKILIEKIHAESAAVDTGSTPTTEYHTALDSTHEQKPESNIPPVGVTSPQSGLSTECHTGSRSNHEQKPAGLPSSPAEPLSWPPKNT